MEGIINFNLTSKPEDLVGKTIKKVIRLDCYAWHGDVYVFTEDNTVIGISDAELGGGLFCPGCFELFSNADRLFAEGIINEPTLRDWKRQLKENERLNAQPVE